MYILSIDPGSKNLVCAIFKIKDKTELVWNYTFNVDHDPNKIAKACQLMYEMCTEYHVSDALLEYQAPIGVACRWNIFIEGGLAVVLSFLKIEVHTLQPSVVKRKLKISTGSYSHNKLMVLRYARSLCKDINTHHLADCFAMADYWRQFG